MINLIFAVILLSILVLGFNQIWYRQDKTNKLKDDILANEIKELRISELEQELNQDKKRIYTIELEPEKETKFFNLSAYQDDHNEDKRIELYPLKNSKASKNFKIA